MVILLIASLVVAATVTVAGAGSAPYNPPANITPSPNFLVSGACTGTPGNYTCTNPCVTAQLTWPANDNTPGCTDLVLRAVRSARTSEGVPALVLPSNWYQLTTPQQLFVVADLERVDRGYPPYLGLNAALSAAAQSAAVKATDPSLAAGFAVGTNATGSPGFAGTWASDISALGADYGWMYDDGWGGSAAATPNVTCTSANAPGCWAHRDELLGSDPGYNDGVGLSCTTCEMGSGYATVGGSGSYVDLVELPAGAPPAMTFTWAYEQAFFSSTSATTTTTMTTTTSVTTTTTSASTSASTPPSTAHARRQAFGLSRLEVQWTSPGAAGVTSVLLRTYRGARCLVGAHVARVRYVASHNTQRGVLISSGGRFYAPRGLYSANVTVANALGVHSSNCFSLGVS